MRKFPFINHEFKAFLRKINAFQHRIILFIRENRTFFLVNFFRKNLIRFGIILIALIVSSINVRSQKGSLLEKKLFQKDGEITRIETRYIEKSNSLALAPIADANELADYEEFLKKEGEKNTVLGALMPVSNPKPEELNDQTQDVFIYKVEDGDTLSSIAQKYSITVNTVLWANDLAEDSVIKPGDEIFILPITGIKHTVKEGDSVKSIAKKYKSKEEKIIDFNELPANGELVIGKEIIVPDGEIEGQPRYRNTLDNRYATLNPRKIIPDTPSSDPIAPSVGLNKFPAHRFPYGWCTWYVATRRHVPWGGNAGTWLYHAKAYGAKTGKTPQKGAIVVTNESRWGHVAIVENVNEKSITVTEMNYKGWGIKSSRTISTDYRAIKGYIY